MSAFPTIIALLASRKDSKYLASFLSGYVVKTKDHYNTEMHVMMSDFDTWNSDVVALFSRLHRKLDVNIQFQRESRGLGRDGLHMYYNMLLEGKELPDWIIYFCEDHHIVADGWDEMIRDAVIDMNLNPDEPYVLVPGWDNTGSMNHVLSRGYLKALKGSIAHHGNLDSYINFVAEIIPQTQVKRLPVMFHDYTHDVPHMMDESHTKVDKSPEGLALPGWGSREVNDHISQDANTLSRVIRGKKA